MATLESYLSPVGFYYAVSLPSADGTASSVTDAVFQEVSGISAHIQAESIAEEGPNRFVHGVPGPVTYDNLVLKRGLIVQDGPLAIWIMEHLSGGLAQEIKPRLLVLTLQDAGAKPPEPIVTWHFANALPIKWEISLLNAGEETILVESLTLTYSYFQKVEASS